MKFETIVPKELLTKLRQQKWYRHGIYRDNILFASTQNLGLGKEFFAHEWLNRGLGNRLRINEQTFILEDEFRSIADMMYAKIVTEPNYLQRYLKTYQQANAKALRVSEEIKREVRDDCTAAQLLAFWQRYVDATMELHHWLWSMEFLNDAIDRRARERMQQWKPEWSEAQINEFLISISFLKRQFPFQREIGAIVNFDMLPSGKVLAQLHERYAWLCINTWDGRPFTFAQYRERISALFAKRDVLRRDLVQSKQKAEEAEQLLSAIDDDALREFLSMIRELIYLKTERIDVYSHSWANIIGLIDVICNRFKITQEQLTTMLAVEIVELLRSGTIPHDLDARKPYVVLRFDDQHHYFAGNAVVEIERAITRDYSHLREVRGTRATAGIVQGTAKVLLTDRELHKLQRGDILISNLTNPNYNPAFELVAGVVTDEGGILCHSAIMAREFNLPCVVGTKIATRVFKDGDLVEVDANTGIVRKIIQ